MCIVVTLVLFSLLLLTEQHIWELVLQPAAAGWPGPAAPVSSLHYCLILRLVATCTQLHLVNYTDMKLSRKCHVKYSFSATDTNRCFSKPPLKNVKYRVVLGGVSHSGKTENQWSLHHHNTRAHGLCQDKTRFPGTLVDKVFHFHDIFLFFDWWWQYEER